MFLAIEKVDEPFRVPRGGRVFRDMREAAIPEFIDPVVLRANLTFDPYLGKTVPALKV
jgi:hypothetical protein